VQHSRRSLKRWIVVSSLLGVLVALMLLLAEWFMERHPSMQRDAGYVVREAMSIVWPSSVALMATYGIERTLTGYVIVLIAIAGNALLYAVIGTLIWWLINIIDVKRQ
jgi:hypothetical protein